MQKRKHIIWETVQMDEEVKKEKDILTYVMLISGNGFGAIDVRNEEGTLEWSKKKSFDCYRKVIAVNGEDLSNI